MEFIKCGSKLFDPEAVTTVEWDDTPGAGNSVIVSTPGSLLVFGNEEAVLVWAYFLSLPSRDLMQRDGGGRPRAVADDYPRLEWDSNQREET
jgi:hypothetical protein